MREETTEETFNRYSFKLDLKRMIRYKMCLRNILCEKKEIELHRSN